MLPRANIALLIVLAGYAALLAWSAVRQSPTFNEIGHVPAGIAHWRYRMFELYRVNPPLPRMVATFPLLFCDVETNWGNYGLSPFSREEIPMGIRFVKTNGSETFCIYTIARWGGIPFCLLGAWICFRWAQELWSEPAGWIALLLWCSSPFILGHGALVMPDVPAAAMAITACYLFWRWLMQPTWGRVAIAGGVLGLALLCKTTLLLLFALWPVLWGVRLLFPRNDAPRVSLLRQAGMLAMAAGLAIYVINLGYGFAGSFQRMEDYRFQSRLLTGLGEDDKPPGNRFAESWLAAVPVPLPRDYLQGIDRQRTDFELGERSYLRGEWKQGGWWYYHLYGLAVKTPSGTLLLLVMAVLVSCFRPAYSRSWVDELCLLLPAVGILALVSSQTGFSNHVRYTIPALPFLFVWMSKVGQVFTYRSRTLATVATIGLGWTVASSMWVYPHSISYFNELAGGPKRGHEHLLDSNVAWGQDLLNLKKWLDKNPQARPLHLASFGWIDPRLAGIEFTLPPAGPGDRSDLPENLERLGVGPLLGWYAIDVNFLHGTHWPAANGEGGWTNIPTDGANYEYFRHFEPVERVAYSFYIYYITPEDAERVRERLKTFADSD